MHCVSWVCMFWFRNKMYIYHNFVIYLIKRSKFRSEAENMVNREIITYFEETMRTFWSISYSFQLCCRVQMLNSNVKYIMLEILIEDVLFLTYWLTDACRCAILDLDFWTFGLSVPNQMTMLTTCKHYKLIQNGWLLTSVSVLPIHCLLKEINCDATIYPNCKLCNFLIFRWCSTIGKKCYILSSLCHLD